MKNHTQLGEAIAVTAPVGGMTSGNGYLFGSLFGVAAETVAAGVSTVIWLKGVYSLTKNSAEAWTVGQLIYWDNVGFKCTTTVGTNKLIGVAAAAAANPSTTGNVRLNGSFST